MTDGLDGRDRDRRHEPVDGGRGNLAKHSGVQIAMCPPRRAQRKGVVDAAVKYTSW
ncbi:MAG TPA: hypothetical protein VG253_19620 [Streptosporangiaceae bacterium]|nr:hypothetical protein [Streptosporangiaceae bacterium]